MSNTTVKVDSTYFTVEKTNRFLKQLNHAAMLLDWHKFEFLFKFYDLAFIENIDEIKDLTRRICTSWRREGTVMTCMKSYDGQCIFCYFGMKVRVYEWTYKHPLEKPPYNRVNYLHRAAFATILENGRLVEFGICNAFTNDTLPDNPIN